MTAVLVVGGAGYIGSHTCKALAAAGHTPIALDNMVAGHREFVRWGPLIVGDLDDRQLLARVMEEWGIDAVVHFAAHAAVGESVRDPARYWRNNVVGSANLVDAARRVGVDALVFSSSCATYGVPVGADAIEESAAQVPISPYGRTKLVTEWLLADYAAAYPMRSVALRYFNACGADPDGEIGEDHRDEAHLIPLVAFAAMGGRPLKVFGDDYDTPDGSAVRDYIHVSDLAIAHVSAVDYLLEGGPSDAFNLGTGTGTSVFGILNQARAILRRQVPHVVVERRPGDPPSLVANAGRAERVLGFRPRHSDMRTILDTAFRWHAERHPFEAVRAMTG